MLLPPLLQLLLLASIVTASLEEGNLKKSLESLQSSLSASIKSLAARPRNPPSNGNNPFKKPTPDWVSPIADPLHLTLHAPHQEHQLHTDGPQRKQVLISIPEDTLFKDRKTIVIKASGVKPSHTEEPRRVPSTLYAPQVISTTAEGASGEMVVKDVIRIPRLDVMSIEPAVEESK